MIFNDKEEYIIGSKFARDLNCSIKEFQDMIERQEDSSSGRLGIILPI